MTNRSIVLAALLAALAAGCAASQAYVRQGDANSVEIGYGGDIENAWPLARRHCAQFERIARLADRGFDTAVFDCVRQ